MNPNALDGSKPYWERAPSTYVEYDGVAREVVDEVVFPAGARLVAEIPAGLIVHELTGDWSLWRRGASAGEPLDLRTAGPPGTYWPELDEQPIFFDRYGNPIRLSSRLPGQVGFGRSFSPDGRYAAIDLDMSDPEPLPESDEVPGLSMLDRAGEIVRYTVEPHRLALIDCTTGNIRVAWGVFDNFATHPVWSDDGEWLVFYAPFIRNRLWTCHVATACLESISFGRRSPPVPRVNVTDLVVD
jgi:WD40-like Beta Propeller Repeat